MWFDQVDNFGGYWAETYGVKLVTLLYGYGNPFKNGNGQTHMFWAVKRGNMNIIKLL